MMPSDANCTLRQDAHAASDLHRPSAKRRILPMPQRCAGRGRRVQTMSVPPRTLPMPQRCAGRAKRVQNYKPVPSTVKTWLILDVGSRVCTSSSMQRGCVNMWPESCAATEGGLSSKSQGQTLRRVVVDLRSQCFAHGQLYVALSRVRNAADVRFLLDVTTCQSVDDNGEEVSGTYAWALAGWCGCWNTDWASAWNRSHGEKCCVEGAAASRTCQSTSSVAAATQRRAARRRSPGHWRRA